MPARLAAAAKKTAYQPSPLTTSEGSDAFAIGRSKTADKGIIFSSDSHHPWEAVGTLFYPWRMKAGSLNVQAFDVAGAAMFFFGHSNDFAWGWTEGPRYTGDCYRIQTVKGDPRRLPVRRKASADGGDAVHDHRPRRPLRLPVSSSTRVTTVFFHRSSRGVETTPLSSARRISIRSAWETRNSSRWLMPALAPTSKPPWRRWL